MIDLRANLNTLASLAHPEGGWAYVPGHAPHLEPTCLALLALALQREEFAQPMERGLDFIRRSATPDAVYRSIPDREEAVWPTALVLFVQASLGLPDEEVARTVSRLLTIKGRVVDLPSDELDAAFDIDQRLMGWPWLTDTFSWVEPTAWACLALRRAGYGAHARVQEGQRLLVDRAFDDGGVNYGNRIIFGRSTEPLIGPTAMMLLALQDQADQPRVAAAAAWLEHQGKQTDDLEHLCWIKLALDATAPHGPNWAANSFSKLLDDKIVRAYQDRAGISWASPSTVREAVTALALVGSEKNPFRLPAGCMSRSTSPDVTLPGPQRPSWGERMRSAYKGFIAQILANSRQVTAPMCDVHIAPVADYNVDLADVLRRQYEAFRQRVPLKGKRVVLKPNYVEFRPNKVINTHPHVVAAAIELCKHEGAAEIVVAEGPGHWRNTEHVVKDSGLGDVLKHYGISFVDLNHDDPVKVHNLGRTTGMKYLWIARTVQTADVFISLAKLKTHHWAGATLSLKNLFGIMPGICYGWPKNQLHWRGIAQSIVDIALTQTPHLAIVDGIIGMEGDGPLAGTAKALGVLVMGSDPLAVDATCCRLMKLDPTKIGYLDLGQKRQLGLLQEAQIQQLGERIDTRAQPFETLPAFHTLYLGRSA